MTQSRTYRWSFWVGLALAVSYTTVGAGGGGGRTTRPSTRPISEKPLLWDASDEEYAVYSAVLKFRYLEQTQARGTDYDHWPYYTQFVLADRTIDLRLFEGLVTEKEDELDAEGELNVPRKIASQVPEAARMFEEVNRRPAKLDQKRFSPDGFRVVLWTQELYRYPEPPMAMSDRFPKSRGVSLLSRVAFSTAGDQAIVSESVTRGRPFMYGIMYLLERKKDGWHVVLTEGTFIT